MSLARLFETNYEYLNTVAKRITRKKDVKMAPELLSTTYLVLFEKQTPFPNDNEGFVKWFSKCMKNYYVWPNSDFNKAQRCPESLTIDVHFRTNNQILGDERVKRDDGANRFDELIVDEDALRDIEILVEDTNDFTRELIEISSSLGKVKSLRYIELVEFKRSLEAHENILFELYFEKELSTRDIAALYSDSVHKMNYQSVNQMVNKIKHKIKEYKWKSYNL